MKNIKTVLYCSILILLPVLLTACGGGGGGGAGAAPVALKFRTYSAATVQQLGAAQFRVLLPQGVSVATVTGSPTQVAPGALALSGLFTQTPFKNYTAGKLLLGSYSSAKPAGSGRDAIRINFSLASNLYPEGEFITINCLALPGSSIAKGNFTISELLLGGSGGVDLTSQYKVDYKVQ